MSRTVKLFIEQVIQQELEEMAKTPQEAVSQSLALYLDNESNDYINAILYDPAAMPEKKTNDPEGIVIGVIELFYNDACNAWQIKIVAAEKGYGPLMYDIGFSLAGEKGMMSDRENVTNSAKKIWNYIAQKRKNDLTPIKVGADCQSLASTSPNGALNYKYVLKHPVDVSQLQIAHRKFLNAPAANGSQAKEQLIRHLGRRFFGQKYGL